MTGDNDTGPQWDPASEIAKEFTLERYKYVLQQIHTMNDNVYRFLAIYQTLATALVGGGLALYVGYRSWGIRASVARSAEIGVMCLVTVIAAFAVLLIVAGIFNWLDYRREECELTDAMVRPGFRKPPMRRNMLRWYETYIVLFILGTIAFLWMYTFGFILPNIT